MGDALFLIGLPGERGLALGLIVLVAGVLTAWPGGLAVELVIDLLLPGSGGIARVAIAVVLGLNNFLVLTALGARLCGDQDAAEQLGRHSASVATIPRQFVHGQLPVNQRPQVIHIDDLHTPRLSAAEVAARDQALYGFLYHRERYAAPIGLHQPPTGSPCAEAIPPLPMFGGKLRHPRDPPLPLTF